MAIFKFVEEFEEPIDRWRDAPQDAEFVLITEKENRFRKVINGWVYSWDSKEEEWYSIDITYPDWIEEWGYMVYARRVVVHKPEPKKEEVGQPKRVGWW